MAAAKQFGELAKGLLVRLVRPLEGNAWLIAAGLAVCSVLTLVSFHLWQRYGDRILSQSRYQLDPDRLVVSPPKPDWIRSDVKSSAVTYGQLNGASLLDRELVLQVKQAFGVQPWVRSVKRVNKKFPSTVEVMVEYRRPLAMVEVPAGMFPAYDYEGLLPVDEEGCLLPVEIDEQEAAGFPKIGGVDTSPSGPPGTPWGDTRVAQAALIVALLEDIWQPLQLYRVEVPPRESTVEPGGEETFVLITRQRRRFAWGSAPGKEGRGEDSAGEKVADLRRFLAEHGPLDSLELDEQASLSDKIGLRFSRRQRTTVPTMR